MLPMQTIFFIFAKRSAFFTDYNINLTYNFGKCWTKTSFFVRRVSLKKMNIFYGKN